MAKLNFSKKINLLIVVVTIFVILATTIVSLIQIRNSVMTAEKIKIRELVTVAYNMVDFYGEKVEKGELTEAQAKSLAEEAIETYNYENGKNYVWINDYNNIMVYNPKRPVHSDCTSTQGPDGKYFYKDITQMARDGEKEFYNYKVVRKVKGGPKEGTIVQKLSTAKDYKPWGWIIATGVYLTEVDAIVTETLELILVINIILLAIIILGVKYLFTDTIVKKLENVYLELKETAQRILSTSRKLNNSSEDLAKGSVDQASSVEEISATI